MEEGQVAKTCQALSGVLARQVSPAIQASNAQVSKGFEFCSTFSDLLALRNINKTLSECVFSPHLADSRLVLARYKRVLARFLAS